MKLATYSFKTDEQKRFGFVHETYMIDILRASAWANKTQNNSNFLHIPLSLKLALENWETNLSNSILFFSNYCFSLFLIDFLIIGTLDFRTCLAYISLGDL